MKRLVNRKIVSLVSTFLLLSCTGLFSLEAMADPQLIYQTKNLNGIGTIAIDPATNKIYLTDGSSIIRSTVAADQAAYSTLQANGTWTNTWGVWHANTPPPGNWENFNLAGLPSGVTYSSNSFALNALAFDSNGNLFVAFSNQGAIAYGTFPGGAVFQWPANGNPPTRIVGVALPAPGAGYGYSRSSVSATSPSTPSMAGITGDRMVIDNNGALYFSDSQSYQSTVINPLIRKVAQGSLSVFAGDASCRQDSSRRWYCQRGLANTNGAANTAATFYWPAGLALDGVDLYVADSANAGYIRKVSPINSPNPLVSTISDQMFRPISVAVSPPFRPTSTTSTGKNTELYVAEMGGHRIWKLTPNSTVGFSKSLIANLNTRNPLSVAVQRKVETVRTWTKIVTVKLLPSTQYWQEDVAYDYVYYSNDLGEVIRQRIEKGRDSYVARTTSGPGIQERKLIQ